MIPEIEIPEVEPALAPGLPEAKTDLHEAPPTLDIKMPEFEDHVEADAIPVSLHLSDVLRCVRLYTFAMRLVVPAL